MAHRTLIATALLSILPLATVHGGINDGLLAHWTFDNTTADSSGNGYNATAYNDYSYVSGVAGDAIRLVGSGHTGLGGGHVLIPSFPLDTMDEFTIGMWVNYEGHTTTFGGESFIQFGRGSSGGNSIYGITYNPDNSGIGYHGGGPWTSGVSSVGTSWPADFENNSWHHYALRVGNGTLTGFLDGQIVGTDSYSKPIGSTLEGVAGIGVHWFNSGGTSSNRFIGSVDDVRIWNRGLSNSEVTSLMTPSQPKTYGLLVGSTDYLFGLPVVRGERDAMEIDSKLAELSSYADSTTLLFNYDAASNNSRRDVENAVDAFAQDVRPGDTFVFFFESHAGGGYNTPEWMAFNETGTGRLLYDDDLVALFDKPEWEQVNKLFVINSCHANGFGRSYDGNVNMDDDLLGLPRTALLAASAENEDAGVYHGLNVADWGRGYLSLAFEKALTMSNGFPRADSDRNGLTFDELTAFISNEFSQVTDDYMGYILADPVGDEIELQQFAPPILQSWASDDFDMVLVQVPEPSGIAIFVCALIGMSTRWSARRVRRGSKRANAYAI